MLQQRIGTARRNPNGSLHRGEYNNATGAPIGASEPNPTPTANVHVGNPGWDEFFHPHPPTAPQRQPTTPAQPAPATQSPQPAVARSNSFEQSSAPAPTPPGQGPRAFWQQAGRMPSVHEPTSTAVPDNKSGIGFNLSSNFDGGTSSVYPAKDPAEYARMKTGLPPGTPNISPGGSLNIFPPPSVGNASTAKPQQQSALQPQQPQSAPQQQQFQPTIGGVPVQHDGAGWFSMTPDAKGQPVKTYATPNMDESMNIHTNGQWGGWSREQRHSYLMGQHATGPVGTVVDSGRQNVFDSNTGQAHTNRTVSGTNGAATEIGPMTGTEKAQMEWKYAPTDSLGNRMPVTGTGPGWSPGTTFSEQGTSTQRPAAKAQAKPAPAAQTTRPLAAPIPQPFTGKTGPAIGAPTPTVQINPRPPTKTVAPPTATPPMWTPPSGPPVSADGTPASPSVSETLYPVPASLEPPKTIQGGGIPMGNPMNPNKPRWM